MVRNEFKGDVGPRKVFVETVVEGEFVTEGSNGREIYILLFRSSNAGVKSFTSVVNGAVDDTFGVRDELNEVRSSRSMSNVGCVGSEANVGVFPLGGFVFVVESQSVAKGVIMRNLNVFAFRCLFKGLEDLQRLISIGVGCALCICDKFFEVVFRPVIYSGVVIDVVSKVR